MSKINSRRLNSNIAAAVAVAALFVLVSFVTTATTDRSLIRSLIRSGSCLPCGEHVIPASCAPVAAGGGSGNKGDKDEEGSYSDSSGDVAVERTAVDFEKMARVPTCPIRLKK